MDKSKLMEDLSKLPYKELRKLAKQNKVNSSCKKDELVKALFNVSQPTTSEEIVREEESMRMGRITRSKSIIFHPSKVVVDSKVQYSESCSELYANENSSEERNEIPVTSNDKSKKRRNAKKGKKINSQKDNNAQNISKNFQNTNIETNTHPLIEITNKDAGNCDVNHSLIKKNLKSKTGHIPASPTSMEDLCVPSNNICNADKNIEKNIKKRVRRKKDKEDDQTESLITKSKYDNLETSNIDVTNEDSHNLAKNKTRKHKGGKHNSKSGISESEMGNINGSKSDCLDIIENGSSISSKKIPNKRKRQISLNKEDSTAENIPEKSLPVTDEKLSNVTLPSVNSVSLSTSQFQESSDVLNKLKRMSSVTDNYNENRNLISTTNNVQKHCDGLEVSSEEKRSLISNNYIEEKKSPNAEIIPLVRNATFVLNDNVQENSVEETEHMAGHTPVLVRGATFICKDNVQENSVENAGHTPILVRDATFICKDNNMKKPRSSMRFSASPALQNKPSPQQKLKIQNSIGNRILSSHIKKQGEEAFKNIKQNKGSTLKKSILKNKSTPGSVIKKTITKNPVTPGTGYRNKFGVSKKLPNFAAIHQKLFKEMESCEDNHKRKLERAQVLMQSPVPNCALSNKNQLLSSRKAVAPKTHTFSVQSPTVRNKATPSIKKPLETPANRFGFKNRINRTEAKDIVGKKLPLNNLENRKDQERTLLKGVRMNKRFMLQMEMRGYVQN